MNFRCLRDSQEETSGRWLETGVDSRGTDLEVINQRWDLKARKGMNRIKVKENRIKVRALYSTCA